MAEWLATEEGFLAVCIEATGKLIGLLNIDHKEDLDGQVHGLGYVFHPDYHGKGYATEACRAGLAHVFGARSADRVTTGTHPDNEPSVRLLKRLGLRQVGDDEWAISREEWLAQSGERAEETEPAEG